MADFDPAAKINDLTRRGFVATSAASSVAAGFALSVQPVQAQTLVVTSADGLDAGMVDVPTVTGPVPAYRAVQSGSQGRPVVLVVQEIFGLHEHIRDVCRRFAKLGYYAIAPSLYHRQGDVTKLATFDEILPIVARVPDAQVMADLDATVALARQSGQADAAKLGITGFCWGGRVVWLYAAHNPGLKAGVAWYGRLVGDKKELQPAHPVDLAERIKTPVLGLYGGADAGIPLATVEQMKTALGAASPSRFQVYAEAPHAFYADYRPSFRPEAAADGWRRATDWFKTHGVA